MTLRLLLVPAVLSLATLAHAAERAEVVDFAKNMEIPAQVTLLKAGGGKPATAPLLNDHPVELRFDEVARDTPKTVACTLNIPKKLGQIRAGEAATIGIKCSEVIELPRSRLGFKLIDGGREIGSGAFRP